MKLHLIILTLILSCYINSSGQVFKAGLVAGLSGSQVDGDGYGGFNKLGFIGGAFVNTNLSENLSTQFEIYFINKGSFKAPHPDKGDYKKLDLNINYIEVPVALRFRQSKFMFEAGLYISKMLSYSLADEFGERSINQYPIKSFDFGGFIGLYYDLNEHFSFNLRSKYSILPIRDFQTQDLNVGIINKIFNRGWYNSDINFTIKYQIGS